MRVLTLCLLCACLAACGVKRPLHLPGQKKSQWPTMTQTSPNTSTSAGQNQNDMTGYGIENNTRTYDPSNPYSPQVQ